MNRRAFDRLVRQGLRRVPRRFRDAMDNLAVVVEDWPQPELMEEVTGDPDAILYGLFTGTPLPERHLEDSGDLPAIIHLYQGPLEEDYPAEEALIGEIEITLVHEIAHFMGFDEDELAELGYD